MGTTRSPQKIQKTAPFSYLDYRVSESTVILQKVFIRCDNLKTLNDFQKLIGDINWLHPALGIPTSSLKHLRLLNGTQPFPPLEFWRHELKKNLI